MASVAGICVATAPVTLTKSPGDTVLSVRTLNHGIRNAVEGPQQPGEEIDALCLSPTVLEPEIRNDGLIPGINR